MTRSFVSALGGCLAAISGVLATPAVAAEPDPIASNACVHARTVLEAALADATGSLESRSHRLALARRVAAETCLGRSGGAPARRGAPEPAVRVPAVIGMTPSAAPRAVQPQPVAPQAPPAIQRPAFITSCDTTGCWDNEGRRLNSQGPVLIGPSGACTQQGGVVHCP